MAGWYTRSCDDCGDEIHIHEDWDNPPRICKSCKAGRAAQWYERSCDDCGAEMRIHRDWDNPPRICKSCKAGRAAQWYERSCAGCGVEMRIHRDWDNPPKFCSSCKLSREAKWYDVECQSCGVEVRAHRDWDNPPKFCTSCRREHAPFEKRCEHCDNSFTVSVGTQVQCKNKGWELPRRCHECRELFKHKPFRTVRETDFLGGPVFRTYNSIHQLISESRDEKDFFGNDRRVHRSPTEKRTGITRAQKDFMGNDYRETRSGDDSRVKSESRERKDFFGNKYTESRGGSSDTKNETRTKSTFWGRLFRLTE